MEIPCTMWADLVNGSQRDSARRVANLTLAQESTNRCLFSISSPFSEWKLLLLNTSLQDMSPSKLDWWHF